MITTMTMTKRQSFLTCPSPYQRANNVFGITIFFKNISHSFSQKLIQLVSLYRTSLFSHNVCPLVREELFFPKHFVFMPTFQDVCPPLWDGASCLPPTLAGHTAILPCMESYQGIYYSPKCKNIHPPEH